MPQAQLSPRRKVVLVTGASRGIGAALVRQLDRAHFEVWSAGRGQGASAQGADRHFAVDFSDAAAVERFLMDLNVSGKSVDILVNNAATVSHAMLAPDLSENYVVNVRSPARITEFLQVAGGLDCVINVVSASAYAPSDGTSALCATGGRGYFLTKFCFVQVQKHLARKHAARCLFFSPGPTATKVQDRVIDSFVARRSPKLARVLHWLNSFMLKSPDVTALGLARLCADYPEVDNFSTVHASGKVEPSRGDDQADARAYAVLGTAGGAHSAAL